TDHSGGGGCAPGSKLSWLPGFPANPWPGGDMGSVKTPPSVVPSPSPDVPPRSMPTVDGLCAWTSEPDHRVVIRGVAWPFYEQLVDSIPEGAAFYGERKWIVIERVSEDGTYQTV